MNSYYSNKIEGQHTLPLEIEQALRNDYAKDADKARRQRLARAHIETELRLEAQGSHLDMRHVWAGNRPLEPNHALQLVFWQQTATAQNGNIGSRDQG
jgi:hypothetical protein